MPDTECEILCECADEFIECDRVPWWKLILLSWLFFA